MEQIQSEVSLKVKLYISHIILEKIMKEYEGKSYFFKTDKRQYAYKFIKAEVSVCDNKYKRVKVIFYFLNTDDRLNLNKYTDSINLLKIFNEFGYLDTSHNNSIIKTKTITLPTEKAYSKNWRLII